MVCKIETKWDRLLLDCFPYKEEDIYFTEKYTSLYENEETKAYCIICLEGDKVLLMPFLRGEIRNYYDFQTAYGYGGPIANTNDYKWCRKALYVADDFLKDQRYVCGFTRFHPLLRNCELYGSEEREVQIIYDRHTIAIDTSTEPEDIWQNQITSKNRNMIRKAEKNGLEYKSEFEFDSIDEFKVLYNETMKRLDAESFYFFGDKYFKDFVDTMKGNAFLGTVRKEGKLICAALFMYLKYYGHYHLEGSDRQYSSFGANNLLLWRAACEMHDLGVREFHLGGGTTASQNDSLFKFKKSFSGNLKDFYIGKKIFNASVYAAICDEWERRNVDKVQIYGNRLLKYRY